MAIAEMSKLNLIGMARDRKLLLDALHRTGAVEIKFHAEEEGLSYGTADETEKRSELSSMEAALDILCRAAEEGDKARKIKEDLSRDGFIVSYSEFVSAKNFRDEATAAREKINTLCDERNVLEAELSGVSRKMREAETYSSLDEKTGNFAGTAHADAKLGTVPTTNLDAVREYAAREPLSDMETLAETADEALVLFVCHKSVSGAAESVLSSCSFTACALDADKSGREAYEGARAERERILLKLTKNEEELYGLRDKIRPLKIYTDYMRFEIEKSESGEKMLETEHTFMLEAYVPKDAQGRVSEAIDSCMGTVYYEYSEPTEDEMPPTLMRNKTVFANFETITNMYSPPNSREFDPTIVMAFFYSLFMGFIMADVGYGVIMLVAGTIVWYRTKAKKSGLNSLSGVFAVGGVFAMAMGAMCNSWFGYSIEAYAAVIPDAQSAMWSFAGIDVPAVLIIAMVVGCVQLAAGYVCRTIQCMKKGDIGGGIWEGMTWTIFAVGACLALIGVTKEFHADILMYVGAIMAGVGLVAAMCTAGRKEKVVGKFTKGFGALYSIINFASDILSYARLYGLMLSGAVVAQLVTGYSIEFFASGKVGMIILAVIILLVGHGFNLAMGLLSAYIHDARLQYVEFYGKFFEGEGELFAPIGSGNQHIYLDLKDAEPEKTEDSGEVTMAARNTA
ncbi:MAG: V-type ATP synthase subunit I [Clostridia bacterium]|nr:V-type ATP synthase subunit I [Clostridia bacterium]